VYGKATATSGWTWGIEGVTNSTLGHGVSGYASSPTGNTFGVMGRSDSEEGKGVYGYANASTGENYGVLGQTNSWSGYGVYGEAPIKGVYGKATATSGWTWGIEGVTESTLGHGVSGYASSPTGNTFGVMGRSDSEEGKGVYGYAHASTGENYGVLGITSSEGGFGVRGEAPVFALYGKATRTTSASWGVYGESVAPSGYGVFGVAPKYGVYGYATDPNGYGGYFKGRTSTDVLEIRGGSDLSERFDIRGMEKREPPIPGMVVCIDPEHTGDLVISSKAYDRTVAGIVSGAGGVRTGMLMGQEGSEADGKSPVALTGRVYCQADATFGTIRPGDLLTTSDTPGHAMKVMDPAKAHGAILGKAMSSLEEGKGLVLVLVTLH
jgi:hypothetical protein